MPVYIVLFILGLLSALVYQRSGKVLFLSKSKTLSYSEKAIRTQLFLLSKLMVCSFVTVSAAFITHLRIDFDFIHKLYIPTLFFLFWYILYKIEPRAFYNIYAEGGTKEDPEDENKVKTMDIIPVCFQILNASDN